MHAADSTQMISDTSIKLFEDTRRHFKIIFYRSLTSQFGIFHLPLSSFFRENIHIFFQTMWMNSDSNTPEEILICCDFRVRHISYLNGQLSMARMTSFGAPLSRIKSITGWSRSKYDSFRAASPSMGLPQIRLGLFLRGTLQLYLRDFRES